jgi:cell division protein FtsW
LGKELKISARINQMKMITKLRRLKLLLHLERFMDLVLGKSSEELLPQSSSDFIYAIIVEEYGLIGGFGVLILYLLLLFRFVVASHKPIRLES